MTKAPNLRKCFRINYIASSPKVCIKINSSFLETVMSSPSFCMAVPCLQSLTIRDLSSIQCTAAPADSSNKSQEIKENHQISAATQIKS